MIKKIYSRILIVILLFVISNKVHSQICVGPLSINLAGSSTANSLEVNVESEDITCASDVNGFLALIVNGGNPLYQYAWNDMAGTDSIRYDLAQGTYYVTITDNEGCTKEVSINIEELNPDNSDLIMNDGCGTCWLNNGDKSYFFDANTDYIASLTDSSPDLLDLGSTEVCVFIDNAVNTCNDSPYLQRQWSINPNNEEDACMKLFFTQQEFDNLAAAVPNESVSYQDLIDNSRVCMTALSGGNESCGDYVTETIYSMADAPPLIVKLEDPVKEIWSVEVCTDKFATFYMHICDYPLPVELIYFTGKEDGPRNLLNWKTASETNTSHFEIEKSNNGLDFRYLNKISAAGNSANLQSYSYVDSDPAKDVDFYRLKIVDFDDSYEYSNVVVIERNSGFSSRVYPNYFETYVYFETYLVADDHLKMIVYDAIGQVAHTQNFQLFAGEHKLPLKLDRLPGGTYFLQVYSEKRGVSEGFKILKR